MSCRLSQDACVKGLQALTLSCKYSSKKSLFVYPKSQTLLKNTTKTLFNSGKKLKDLSVKLVGRNESKGRAQQIPV